MANTEVVIVQPLVPLYRRSFFNRLQKEIPLKIYTYQSGAFLKANGFTSACISTTHISNARVLKAVLINVFPLLIGPHQVIVLGAENKIISNWVVLLLGRFFGKKVILWGHGLNARFYYRQVKQMPFVKKLMYCLADGAWFYTANEQNIWRNLLPNLKSVALGNTVDAPLDEPSYNEEQRQVLKKKYGIATEVVFIFCARFNNPNRRVDLLIQFIERLDPGRFGFIIIGGGNYKPDFSSFSNVYDFGAVYNQDIKRDLFNIADVYFQPAAVGLSVVDAMANGKAVLTFKRSKNLSQGVEYGYIQNNFNGMIFENMEEIVAYATICEKGKFAALGARAREYVLKNLTTENMVANAIKGINMVVDSQCES